MSQYNIVNAGPVFQDHGIIDYLQGSEPFMRLMAGWQQALNVCLFNLSKANLESLVTGEGEGYEELVSRVGWSIIDQHQFGVPVQLRSELHEFMKTISKEYRTWEFNCAIDEAIPRDDEYTEGMCIIHNLHKDGSSDTGDSQVMAQYFADRVSRGVVKALEMSYKDALSFFMRRHPKEFKHGVMRLTFSGNTPVVKFQLALTMEE